MANYILIKSNDSFDADNIDGRLQNTFFDSYEEAYNAMKDELVSLLSLHDKRYEEYLCNVLAHAEYSNVFLGEWEAREHSNYGKSNRYWKIVEIPVVSSYTLEELKSAIENVEARGRGLGQLKCDLGID